MVTEKTASLASDLYIEYATGAKPFIKWVGGKGQLLPQFQDYYPSLLRDGKLNTYIEPFMGGAAVFFDVVQKFAIKKAFLFDINPELVITYNVVKSQVQKLIAELEILQQKYLKLSREDRKMFFYDVRALYNESRSSFDFVNESNDWVTRASQMIFLNKTCFNGLFRLNARGGFNTPAGDYANPTICDKLSLMRASETLKVATVCHQSVFDLPNLLDDFSNAFVYFDPPYRPLNQTSNFTSYSMDAFGDKEQIALKEVVQKVSDLDAHVMVSNSDPKVTDVEDNFFDDLYAGFKINRVRANRMINSKADKRGAITELLITNY